MPACPLKAHAQWPGAAMLLLHPVAEKAMAGVLITSGLHTFVYIPLLCCHNTESVGLLA